MCLPVDLEGRPIDESAWVNADGDFLKWESDCLVIEWFDCVVVLFTTNIRPINNKGN